MFDFFKKKTIEEKMDIIKTSYEKQQESMVESKSPGKKYIWVEGFVPDVNLIKKLNKEFCEPMKKKRPI